MLKTHIGVCQLVRTLFTLRCLQTLYRPHSSQGVGSVQALKDAQRIAGRGNLFNLWLGPGMSTMRRHYKSPTASFDTLAICHCHLQASERVTTRDNGHSTARAERRLLCSHHLVRPWKRRKKARASICGIYLVSFCAVSFLCITHSIAFASEDLNWSPRCYRERKLFRRLKKKKKKKT